MPISEQTDDQPLFEVVTISEAAMMWRKRTETVRRAMGARKKRLIARKSLGTYLITVQSLERRWGKPKYEFSNEC